MKNNLQDIDPRTLSALPILQVWRQQQGLVQVVLRCASHRSGNQTESTRHKMSTRLVNSLTNRCQPWQPHLISHPSHPSKQDHVRTGKWKTWLNLRDSPIFSMFIPPIHLQYFKANWKMLKFEKKSNHFFLLLYHPASLNWKGQNLIQFDCCQMPPLPSHTDHFEDFSLIFHKNGQ